MTERNGGVGMLKGRDRAFMEGEKKWGSGR